MDHHLDGFDIEAELDPQFGVGYVIVNSDESVLDGDYAEREDAAMALCLNTIRRGHALCLRCRERWIGSPCEQQKIAEPTIQKMRRPSDAEIGKHAELMERLNAIIAKRNRVAGHDCQPP